MFASISDCRGFVELEARKVSIADLARPVANVLGALDGIERIRVRATTSATPIDGQDVDHLKLEARRNLRLLSKSTNIPYTIPDNLTEEVFFSKEEADKPPTIRTAQ